ncbi:MAG: hypothetical protein V3V01_20565 [Acidimicrobiales bacterium]
MTDTTKPVSPDDIEAQLRGIKNQVDEKTGQAKAQAQSKLIPAGVGAAILVLLIGYLFGRRAAKRTSSVVEIRRI